MARVLLTGASGLIGRYAQSELLSAGHEVITVGRAANADLRADLLKNGERRAAIESAKSTHLVHLAWYASSKDRWTAAENLNWSAVTIMLLKEFAESGGERAVCAGSCAEYDWKNSVLKEEITPLRPTSLYGKAKAHTGSLACNVASALGLSLSWARIFFCYGPGEPEGRLLGDLINGIMAERCVDCTDGLQKRDFLHAKDVASALAQVLVSELEGPVNVASGEAIEVRELISLSAKLMGRPDLVRMGQVNRPDNDPSCLVGDTTKLKSIGFAPKFSLEEGLRDCIKAAREARQ